MGYTVKLKTLAEETGLTAVRRSANYEEIEIEIADVNRPALQLTGYYDYFNFHRLQIIGRVETAYLQQMNSEERKNAFDRLLEFPIPALVVCHECEVLEECIEAAEKYDRTILKTDENTANFEAKAVIALRNHLAPRLTMHGVLVEIYGEGVLITGESGMGKSECALELIKRGHRLIADDAVEIKNIDGETLIGTAPELIRYYMELRGIGVINVRHIFGVGAVKPDTSVQLVVRLEPWDDNKIYDRLGLTDETLDILGITVPQVTIPVRPGRNLAAILELAAMNNRQKKMGYNAAETFAAEVDASIDNA